MKIHSKYLSINSGRIFIFALSILLAKGHREILFLITTLICVSFIYLIIETFFNLSEKYNFIPYIATSFDIIATMIYCYLTGLSSVFFGAYVYITAICSLNPKNKQAEFSLFFSFALQIIVLLLVQLKKIDYVNLFYYNSVFNLVAAITTIILTFIVNYLVYIIVRKLVKTNYDLLCNIIPESILPMLQEKKAISNLFQSSTIVFTDFVKFTETTKNLSPSYIVQSLEYYFNNFDLITKKNGVEKLKTIGDGYMYAAGLPLEDVHHRENAVKTAIEILEFCTNNCSEEYLKFDIRIGICTGPVLAAIIGKSKFQYDVWGPTVNLASRLESSAVPNSICITNDNLLYFNENEYIFDFQKVNIKGFGNTDIINVQKNRTTAST